MNRQVTIGPAVLILADSRGLPLDADAVITDPPYGIGYKVNRRVYANRCSGLKRTPFTATAAVGAILGDDEAFDPAPWLRFSRAAFFGAQHFSHRLPQGRWLVWDKRRESEPDSHSDADLVWLSDYRAEALRVHRQKWRGVVREGEENASRSKKLHPNQKPVALMERVIDMLQLRRGQTVLDPYMGSGSTGVAAVRRGLAFVGVEIDEEHFQTAVDRLREVG